MVNLPLLPGGGSVNHNDWVLQVETELNRLDSVYFLLRER